VATIQSGPVGRKLGSDELSGDGDQHQDGDEKRYLDRGGGVQVQANGRKEEG
jgi:hypothetical protein